MQDCSLFRDARQRLGAFNKGRIKDDRCSHAYKYASLRTSAELTTFAKAVVRRSFSEGGSPAPHSL